QASEKFLRECYRNGFCGKPDRLAAPPWPARPALAGHARSVPHLAVGGDAAADPGRCRHPLLRALLAPLPDRGGARIRLGRRGSTTVGRARLLRPWKKPAR